LTTATVIIAVAVLLFMAHFLFVAFGRKAISFEDRIEVSKWNGGPGLVMNSWKGVEHYGHIIAQRGVFFLPNFFGGERDGSDVNLKHGGGGIGYVAFVVSRHILREDINRSDLLDAAERLSKINPGPTSLFARGLANEGITWGVVLSERAIPLICGMIVVYLAASAALFLSTRWFVAKFKRRWTRWLCERRIARIKAGLCPSCRYPLTMSGKCSECGEESR
jgi:hypothetical protein